MKLNWIESNQINKANDALYSNIAGADPIRSCLKKPKYFKMRVPVKNSLRWANRATLYINNALLFAYFCKSWIPDRRKNPSMVPLVRGLRRRVWVCNRSHINQLTDFEGMGYAFWVSNHKALASWSLRDCWMARRSAIRGKSRNMSQWNTSNPGEWFWRELFAEHSVACVAIARARSTRRQKITNAAKQDNHQLLI